MDWLMGLCVLGGWRDWEVYTGDGMQFMLKMLISFVLMLLAEFVFNCRGHKADRMEWNWCAEDRDAKKEGWTNTERLSNRCIVWRMDAFIDVVFIYTYKFIIFLLCLFDPLSSSLPLPLALFLSLNALLFKSRTSY